ncbi:hypothetical protein GGI35DRAFT_120850 [Trichoderma velutinum]
MLKLALTVGFRFLFFLVRELAAHPCQPLNLSTSLSSRRGASCVCAWKGWRIDCRRGCLDDLVFSSAARQMDLHSPCRFDFPLGMLLTSVWLLAILHLLASVTERVCRNVRMHRYYLRCCISGTLLPCYPDAVSYSLAITSGL